MSKFTPGLWETEYDNHGNGSYSEWLNILAPNKTIAQVGCCRKMTEEDKANAYLIAAAPELYEAIEAVISFLEYGIRPAVADPLAGEVGDEADELKKALAKAEGK